jgi:hypothetical protein
MIALFKTHNSFGRSILTIDPPEKDETTIFGVPYLRSVLSLGKALPRIFCVEDSLCGLKSTISAFENAGKQLVFGLRLDVKPSNESCASKIVVFANGSEGILALRKLDTLRHESADLVVDLSSAEAAWLPNNLDWRGLFLQVVIPFYDSFLAKNVLSFTSIDLNPHESVPYFEESNGLPQDVLISRALVSARKSNEVIPAKTIYYPSRVDFDAWLTYKIVCSRKFSKSRTLDAPNEDHCGSVEFCWESYLEQSKEEAK